MNRRELNFVTAIVGDAGAKALAKSTSYSSDLSWAIVPRIILSWLNIMSQGEYTGNIPGLDDAELTFRKSEKGFSGSVCINSIPYVFDEVGVDHIAAGIAVALGTNASSAPVLANAKLGDLGKSIDLLVKSRTLVSTKNYIEKRITKPAKLTLTLSKSDAKIHCSKCGGRNIREDKYVGCLCFFEMAKTVEVKVENEGFVLEFGEGWEAKDVESLKQKLGK